MEKITSFKKSVEKLYLFFIAAFFFLFVFNCYSQSNAGHKNIRKENIKATSVIPNALSELNHSEPIMDDLLKSYQNTIYFTQNKGQWPDSILFKADFNLGQALVTKSGMIVGTFDPVSIAAANEQVERWEQTIKDGKIFNEPWVPLKGHGWKMKFKNSSPKMSVAPKKKHLDYFNYFLGGDKSKFASNVYNYGEIFFSDVYDKIDVRYYPAQDGSLEYDIICKPGADLSKVELQLDGINGLVVQNGKLKIKTSVGEMDFPEPYSYQMLDGKEVQVKTAYKATGKTSIGFDVKNYDASKPLIIDPIALRWATWISNNASQNSHGHGIWVDQSNNAIYVTGWYQVTGLITVNAFQSTSAGGVDLFIGRYAEPASVGDAGTRVWQTYLGSGTTDNPYALEQGPDGNIYIVGYTSSNTKQFPLKGGSEFSGTSLDNRSQSGQNIFIMKINQSGTSFKAAVVGGNSTEEVYDLRFTKAGNIVVAGSTKSTNLSTLYPGKGASNTNNGGTDVLVFSINKDLNSMLWMRNYGGSGDDQANIMLAHPTSGSIFIGGATKSSNFPTNSPRQSSLGGTQSGFLQKLNASGSTVWSSYFKAISGSTSILCMEFNFAKNKFYFGGLTDGLNSANVSASGVYQSSIKGGTDFFIALMDTNQVFAKGTYLGSSSDEYNMMGLNVDLNDDVYIFGYTPGTNFPVTSDALQSTNLGSNDKTFTKVKSDFSQLLYGTYYGGSSDDYDPVGERGIKFSACRIYTIVTATSKDIPLTQGAITTNKLSSTSILEPGLVVWANPPDLDGNIVSGNQTVCPGQVPSTLTGTVPFYKMPAIVRNGVLSNYPDIGIATTYQWQRSLDSINWVDVTGGNTPNLAGTVIGAISQKTYFRRVVGGDACVLPGASAVVINIKNINVSGSIINVKCYGQNTGAINTTVSGGSAPYTYLWSNDFTTANLTSVLAGSYSVTVTDADGCQSVKSFTIIEPSALDASFTTIPVDPCGLTNGSASVSITGGVAPYTYLWSNGETGQTVTAVAAGTYTVTIKDANNCQLIGEAIVTSLNATLITGNVTNASCNGANDGAITVSLSSGVPPYTILWSDGPTTQNRSGLTAGQYTIKVTDVNNCVASKTFTVAQPVFAVNVNIIKAISCFGGSDGSLSATITGGSSPFTYLWSNGFTLATSSGLSAGAYTVTVTDAKGCKKVALNTLANPPLLTAACEIVDSISCYNTNTGQLTVYANGGTSPYTYLWSNGSTNVNLPNIGIGNYSVTVTDAKGCIAICSKVLNQPADLVINMSTTPVGCNVDNSGTATASPVGGRAPYRYAWSTVPSQTTATATGLITGTYTVTVTDNNGCVKTASVIVTSITGLTVSITAQTNVDCFGNNTGSATVTPANGSSPFTYLWNTTPAQTTAKASNLAAGTYTVTVTDKNACSGTTTATITQPAAQLTASILSKTDVLCYGQCTGSATVTVSGGTQPYAYVWEYQNKKKLNEAGVSIDAPGCLSTNPTCNNLCAGNFIVFITDKNGCTTSVTVTITQPVSALSLSISSQTDILCFGANTGSASVTASGGSAPYTYLWNTSPAQTTAMASNLYAGSYSVTVTDNNGCTQTKSVTINQPASSLSANISSKIDVLCYGDATGAATVLASGGTSPYSYLWSNNATTATINNLTAGTYTVTITDKNGCTTTISTVITQPSGILTASITAKSDVTYFGGNNGSATVKASGGTSPYTYLWNTIPAQTNATATNLTAGIYTVTVTDNNGCTTTVNVTINQPSDPLTSTITSKEDVLCFGGNNGSATVTANGGTTPYTYLWSNNATTATINNLTAGTYTVTVTDFYNNITTSTAIISQPSSALNAAISTQTNVLCYGESTGAATVIASGGTSPYTYLWSNNATTATITNLASGSYTVTVKDKNNCTSTATVNITQPNSALTTNISSKTNVLCYGDFTGSATVSASGGTSPYSYLWNSTPAQTTATATALSAGTYSVTITDNNGCIKTESVTISQPASALSASINDKTDVKCYGEATGSAKVTASGGTTAYAYLWSNNATTAQINNLTAGTYTVTVTDKNGCTITESVIISQPSNPLQASITGQSNVTWYSGNNGSATVTASGGTAPYSYLWNTTPAQTGGTATNLPAGTYTVTVTDKNGCTTTATVTITQPSDPLTAIITSKTDVLCYGGNNGSATVTVSGGTAPYTYLWSNNATTATINNLTAGTYVVTVTDFYNNTVVTSATISQPAAELSASLSSKTDVGCYGESTGSAAVTASGGTAPYTYLWNIYPAQNTPTVNNLSAGNYTVTVTDFNNCTKTVNVTINQPATSLASSIPNKVNVDCYGEATGSATVSASGGTSPYTYLWSNNATTATINNLVAGNYTVTITDKNGCTNIETVTINQPVSKLTAAISSKTDIFCYGDNTGSAKVTAYGGTAPYNYLWSNNATTQQIDNLSAGQYYVTVTDYNGCTSVESVVITEPSGALSASITSQSNVTFFGGSNGSATVTATGGTALYSYLWNTTPPQNSSTASNLSAGTYKVTVTDHNNCKTTVSVVITEPGAALTATITSQTNILCYGDATGSATVTAQGGTTPYTYLWNNTKATATINNLTAGTYTVTVKDFYNNTVTATAVITQPSEALAASVTSTNNVLCKGGNSGSATVTATGGTGPYAYLWSNNATTATVNNLSAGTYTVTVTDNNGCKTTATTVITEPEFNLSASITAKSDVTFFGGNNGSATVTATGGTTPYSYIWNTVPVQTTQTASGLTAGNYTVTVTDNNGCITKVMVAINQPSDPLTAVITSKTDILCFGGNNGSAKVIAAGGTAPYTYLWNTTSPQTTATVNNLPAGIYTVTVTDFYNNVITTSANITQPTLLEASVTSKTDVLCYGESTGAATVLASGGTPPYTYLWSNNATTATINNLTAGTYTVTITDKNGCKTTTSTVINQPSGILTASITAKSDVTYFGGNNGSATVKASGGTSPYTYLWNTIPAQTNATATNLTAGIYTVTVTDNNGCTTTVNVTINQPSDPLTSTITSKEDVLCFGGNNGSATVTANGGTTPYTYLWSNNATTATINNLTAGTYTVTVTDFYNNITTSTAIISQPSSALNAAISTQTNVLCYGESTGAATVIASGGTSPYTYLWSNNATTATITNLASGSYTVTVKDKNNCTSTATVNITQPNSALTTNISSKTNVLCYGDFTGSATVSASGGTSPYSYLWNSTPAQTTATATALSAGTYSVTITDNNGCIKTESVTISQPASALSASINDKTDVKCYGEATGSAKVTASGGTTAYAYLWSNNATTAQINNLTAGTYTVTVTDKNGCTITESVIISQPSNPLQASITGQSNVTWYSGNNGSATVTASGGTAPYSYLWNTTPAQTGGTATNLPAGTYTVTVTDKNGCTTTATVTITQPSDPLTAIITSKTDVLCYGGNNGSATVTVSGGTAPYTYLWSNNATTATINNLTAGTYVVTVTDFYNNTVVTSATISQPAAELSASLSSKTDVGCFGEATGSATVTATGGTAPYIYLWNTSPAQVAPTAGNLLAGIYTITVTDKNNCLTTTTVTINQPSSFLASEITEKLDVKCYGEATGSAIVLASGGTAPYTYLWSNNVTTAKISGLYAGIYSVTITDKNGCITTNSVIITQPSGVLTASITELKNATCFSCGNGSATVTATGGTAPYYYSWNTFPPQNTATATKLKAGIYTVIISDENSCVTTLQVIITQPSAELTASITSKTNVGCFGSNTGSATVTATGGTTPYTYLWNTTPPQTTTTINNLAAGVYTVTITDYYDNIATATAIITQPSAVLAASITSSKNISCFGGNDGSATVTSTGGTGPYSYLWSNNSTDQQINNLSAGTYLVTVTDNNNCVTLASITLTEPASALSASITEQSNVTWFGGNNGTATVTASGGTEPYSYLWNTTPPQTTAKAFNLEAGTYTVTVTDKNGCTTTATVTIIQPSDPLTVQITSKTDIICFGNTTGSATVTAYGGTSPYTYLWSNGKTTATVNNLSAGTYTVTVTDFYNNTVVTSATISQPAAELSASLSSKIDAGCFGEATGSATVTATGGTAPYSYKWDSSPEQTGATAFNLASGYYTVTVKDYNNCITTVNVYISQPAAPLTVIPGMQTNVNCYGEATGSATVIPSGGTVPYTYLWSDNSTNQQINNLTAGTYTVTVADKNNCKSTTSVLITQPPAPLSSAITEQTDVLCYGDATGSAKVTSSGGTTPYTYIWSNSATTAIINNLTAGTYTVTITDKNGCTITESVIISQPSNPLQASITGQSNVTWYGGNNGSATVKASGGTSPYTYLWNTVPAQTNGTATKLPAGTYMVTVTDKNGCATTVDLTITQPSDPLTATITSKEDVLCYGGNTGIATVTANGGTAPYTYLWSNNATTEIINNLTAGTYTITVTDFYNNTITATAIISQPSAALSASPGSVVNVLCFGEATGSATVTASGGTAPYTYLWSNNETASKINNLTAGTYTVTVTDANNCTVNKQIFITQPVSALSTNISQKTNIDCFGNSTGSATVAASGGTSPYTYLWNTTPEQTTAKAGNIAAGNYTVTVTDKNGCTEIASVTLTQSAAPLSAEISSQTNVLCYGDATGSATATATGGTSPYNYKWSNNATTQQINNLTAGTYTVTVTDKNGCTDITNVVITEPSGALTASITSQSNVTWFGGNNGSATVTASGGTAPYSYLWSTTPAKITSTANNLTAGIYKVTITDNNGCITTATVTITEPSSALSATITSLTNVLCFGEMTGIATVTATGGTAPYTYLWSNNKTTTTITNLAAGSYTVTVTDFYNNTATATAVITQPSETVAASVTTSTNILCYGEMTGTATVTATGGTGPYSYLWNNNATTQSIVNLAAGNYIVTVTDKNNCETTANIVLTQPLSALEASITQKGDVTYFGGNNGSATVTASGGTNPYIYLWSSIPPQTSAKAYNLEAGTYTVTVTDKNGCTKIVSVIIGQPDSPLTVEIIKKTDILCYGDNTGSVTILASGGTAPYTYLWSNSASTTDINNLYAGVYTVTVTDKFDNTVVTSVTINQPAQLIASVNSQNNVLCYDDNTGSATVTVSGGVGPYSYLWSNGSVGNQINNLAAGQYTVTITDNNGCKTTASTVITQPVSALQASVTALSNVTYFDGDNGFATITATGGTSPYTYLWNTTPPQTAGTGVNLKAGTYSVTVTDNNGCSTTVTVIITQPSDPLTAQITSQNNVLCYGGNNGTATVTAFGGTSPYTYLWSNNSTTATINNLSAGTYTVTVTDYYNNTVVKTAVITQPAAALSASISSKTEILCFGDNSGTATVEATGGTAPYSYLWNTGSTTSSINNLTAGLYTVTITDKNGCTTTKNVTISQPSSALSAIISSKQDVLCFGNATGTATVTASGGTAPYTYHWSTLPQQTTVTANNLAAGSYSVTVTDKNNCVVIIPVVILQPAEKLSATFTVQNVLCFGDASGRVTVNPSGGTGPYSYLWSNNGATQQVSGLTAGMYSVTITDKNNCTLIENIKIEQPGCPVTATINFVKNVTSFGGNDGIATVNVCCGTAPYTYLWNSMPEQTTTTAINLKAGTYMIAVSDANGCKDTAYVTITQPSAPLAASITSFSNVLCFGSSTGSATVTATGGTAPYTYLWNSSPVQTGATAYNLPAGTYTVTVTDFYNYTTLATVVISEPVAPLSASIDNQNNVSCFGDNDAAATVTASGGTPPYSYIWNTTPVQSWQKANNLSAGTYVVTVTDKNGCTTTANTVITQPAEPLSASITSKTDVVCNESNGTATVTPYGGTAPYTYKWNSDPVQTTDKAINLSAGNYKVTITDDNGCTVINSVTINTLETAPKIVTQPQSASECSGSPASLTIESAGTGLYYQWFENNVMITDNGFYTGSTSPTLNIDKVTYDLNNNIYTCVVTYSCGSSITSDPAVLTVKQTPEITSVTDATRDGAGTLTLNATANFGTINWFENSTGGSSLATGNNFTTPVLTESKTYYVSSTSFGCTSPRVPVNAIIVKFDCADNIIVSNTNDTGFGSLRRAILEANSCDNTDTILFNIPTTDPGYNPETGKFTICITSGDLPAIMKNQIVIDGRTEAQFLGINDLPLLGTGGTVGTGSNALNQVTAPMIQVINSSEAIKGLTIDADKVSILGLSISGFGVRTDDLNLHGNIVINEGAENTNIQYNVFGLPYQNDCSMRSGSHHIIGESADSTFIKNNLFYYSERAAVVAKNLEGWSVINNEFIGSSTESNLWGAVLLNNSDHNLIEENLIYNSAGIGIDMFTGSSYNTINQNTIHHNGLGEEYTAGVRVYGDPNRISFNIGHL
ncbi:MAG: hypothetical protein KA792_00325 [Bacteroidales bacterium]|nr:hypothetical protein [Bacteroidales bacterium]